MLRLRDEEGGRWRDMYTMCVWKFVGSIWLYQILDWDMYILLSMNFEQMKPFLINGIAYIYRGEVGTLSWSGRPLKNRNTIQHSV